MRLSVKGSTCENANMASMPLSKYDTVVAVTAVTSRGRMDDMVRSSSSTSITKRIPAIGALNMPAMAPAAPQPTRIIRLCCSSLKNLPRLEPMAEPVSTMGASAPTEPPNPMVTELATSDECMLWGLMRLLRCEMEKRILVTPWLMSSFTMYLTYNPAMRMPAMGKRR